MATKRTIEMAVGSAGLDAQGRPRRSPVMVSERGAVTTLCLLYTSPSPRDS